MDNFEYLVYEGFLDILSYLLLAKPWLGLFLANIKENKFRTTSAKTWTALLTDIDIYSQFRTLQRDQGSPVYGKS